MKKAIIAVAILCIPLFSCFAGGFYSNIVLLVDDPKKIIGTVLLLIMKELKAYYVSDFEKKSMVLYEEKLDDQNIKEGFKLAYSLSKSSKSITVYTTSHDGDVLVMIILKNGESLFAYNSNPGYFNGEDIPPMIKDIDKLLLEYKDVNREDLLAVLESTDLSSEDIHKQIVELLHLPGYSVDLGYQTLIHMDEQDKIELGNEYGIKITKLPYSPKNR